MKNLAIRWRLRGAVVFLAVLVVVVGVFGLIGMYRAVDGLRGMYSGELVASRLLGDMEIQIGRGRAVILRASMAPTPDITREELDKGQMYWAASDKSWNAYLELPADDKEKQLAAVVAERRQALKALFVEFSDTVRAGKTSDYYDVARRIGDAYTAVVKGNDVLKQYQESTGRTAYEGALSTYHALTLTVVLLVAFAVLAAWLTSWSLVKAISAPLEDALTQFAALANGDLTRDIRVDAQNEMGRLFAGIAEMRDRLAATVGGVRQASESIATATKQIAAGNQDLSSRTEEQAASLGETAASMEELTATVRQNAENARLANRLADGTRDVAVEGGGIVGQVVDSMKSIQESSEKINDIIGIIESIAFQTNILALNAAVEAARAGEQGRGFAVVAGEVRTLAQRSAEAAKEIKNLIETSTDRVNVGSEQATRAGETMNAIQQSIQRLNDVMSEIAAASDEQTRGIEQINQAVGQMDEVTQQNAALVEEAAAAAGGLEAQAAHLRDAMTAFRLRAA